MPRSLTLSAVAVLAALGCATTASAATIPVDSTKDQIGGNNCTLRNAVEAANSNSKEGGCPKGTGTDTIEIPGGYYKLKIVGTSEDANQDGDLDITTPVNVEGAGATKTTIDAGGNAVGERAFHVVNGDKASFSDLTVRRGVYDNEGAGAIFADYGDGGLKLSRVRLVENHGYYGGGVSAYGSGKLTIENSTFADNDTDDGYGAGVYSYDNDVLIKNSKIFGNVGDDGGGGVYLEDVDSVTIKDTRVANNLSTDSYYGAGIYVDSSTGKVKFDRITVTGNAFPYPSGGLGGGIYVADGDVELKNSTVSGNFADSGGGIYHAGLDLEINGSTISGNSAQDSGGGVYQSTGDANVRNTTISGNGAYGYSGGYYTQGTSAEFNNVTIYRNQSYNQSTGIGLYEGAGTVEFANSIIAHNRYEGGDTYYDCYGGTSAGNNLVSNDDSCGTTPDDLVGDSAEPLSPRLDPLAKNGGPTQTHALLAGSPALGAGGPDCESKDQRGHSRANQCDLGAFER